MNENGYHVATKTIVLDDEGRLLALRRSDTAPTRPLQWDLPGGVLEIGEEAEAGARREIREESGLEMFSLAVFDVIARFNAAREYWVTIYYWGKPTATDVALSYEHDMYRWVAPEEFAHLPGSPRNAEAVRHFIELRRA